MSTRNLTLPRARGLVDTFAALDAVLAAEPEQSTGSWGGWFQNRYTPAAHAWSDATEAAQPGFGIRRINTHPDYLVPLAERIIAEHHAASDHSGEAQGLERV